MTFNSARSMMLGVAIMLCPAVVLAQNEPGMPSTMPQGNPAPSGQPQPGPSQQRTPMPSMQDSSDSSGQTIQTMKDKMFLRAVAAGGIAEVQFGQLATQKSQSEDVKTFGQKMVDDHTALNKDMESIADSMGVKLSTHMNKDDQAEYDKLKGLSGDDFDKEYISMMVRDHHHDLREFRLEAANTQDQTLKDAVVKGQKVIHEHLVMVNSLAKNKGIDVPHRGGNSAPPPTQ